MSSSKFLKLFILAALIAGLLPATLSAAPPGPGRNVDTGQAPDGPGFDGVPADPGSVPAAPPQVESDVNLELDDGSAETFLGVNDGVSGVQFTWLNRFTPSPADFPFDLTQISVLFGFNGVPVGGAVDLLVFEDTDGDGDPSDATLLAVINETVQFADGTTWSDYTLASPIRLDGPGDVVIGVINRYQDTTFLDFPAGLDTNNSQMRSWAGWWSAHPPDPTVTWPPDASWGIIDVITGGAYAGNWAVRAYGDIPGFTGILLRPPALLTEGCAGASQTHEFSLENQTGAAATFDLTYDVPSGNGTLTGPATLPVANGTVETFDVVLTPDDCQYQGIEVLANIHAVDPTGVYSATSYITKTIVGGLNEWLPAANTPLATRYHAVAYHDGYLFQFAGETDWWTPTTTVSKYDVASDTWSAAAPIPTGVYGVDAVTIGDLIYLPGGSDDLDDSRDGGTFLTTLHIYDPVANSWSTGAPMPAPLAYASAVTSGGDLYVIGGLQNDGTATNALYIYDVGTNSWSTGTSMTDARSLAAAAAIDGKIYVAGGYLGANAGDTTIDTFEIYDIATDTWSAGPSLPENWAPYGDGALYDRYLIIFNGGDLSQASGFYCSQNAMWYDTVNGDWEDLPLLPRCLYGSQGAAAGSRFFTVSGRTNEGGSWHMAPEVQYLEACPACTEIGWLDGYVLDSETGDVDPTCTGATVLVEPGGIEVAVDPATGYYWADLYAGTYDVSATATGYSVEVETVDVTTAMTTSQDFNLWRPIIDVDPQDFVPVTAVVDDPTTLPLDIINTGHEPLEFEILEIVPGGIVLDAGASAFQTTWLEGDVEIEPLVLEELDARGATDFFVEMRLQADPSPAYGIEDWAERGQYVYNSLEAASAAQAPVIAYAQEYGLEHRSYLINNAVLIKGGTLDDLQALASMPEVKSIRANRVYELDEDTVQALTPEDWGWNLDSLDPDAGEYGMEAAQVWQDFGIYGDCEGCGYDGEDNIVVASVDTGVFYQHEALVRQYRGNLGGGTFEHDYNWYAPTITATNACPGAATTPCDFAGHGSGVTGIMVGETADLEEQIGIAPHGQWIACMGCDTPPNGCSREALLACADWILAPTMVDGTNPDPDKRPHVVNNSWGGTGCDDWYEASIDAWRAAGVFPAFSAGNTTACGAVGAPGDTPNAFSSAAHNQLGENQYAGGPSCWFPNPSCDPSAHEVDPHLNAPTFGRTAGNTPGAYWSLSGTSGASPHTAGCVALMWAANPELIGDIETTFTILEQSADRTSTQPWAEGDCGKPACAGTDAYPNYEYGWGYLDCHAAVDWALDLLPALDWVTVEPPTGTVPALDTMTVDVTFLCTETKVYTGTLRILHNAPCDDPVDVPIELHCVATPPLSYYYLPIIVKNY